MKDQNIPFQLLTGQKFPKQNTKVKQELLIGKQYNSRDYGLESLNIQEGILLIIGVKKAT